MKLTKMKRREIGGNRSKLTGGDWSKLTGGYRSALTGGDGSTLTFEYCDRGYVRRITAYVGEDGIKPNTPYTLNKNHEIEEVKK